MQKSKDVLLILSAEEREEAKSFIRRQFKVLGTEQVSQLQILSQLARQMVRCTQMDKSQYARTPSRAGKLMNKLHEAALVDLKALVENIEETVYTLEQNTKKEAIKGDDKKSEDVQKIEDLIITCQEEEVQYANEVLTDRVEHLDVSELKVFRDTCQEMLSWWESERGQVESLHLDKVGDVNSAGGRVAIRQKREQMQRETFNPFKAFFQHINTMYQRTSKEAANQARIETARKRNLERHGI